MSAYVTWPAVEGICGDTAFEISLDALNIVQPTRSSLQQQLGNLLTRTRNISGEVQKLQYEQGSYVVANYEFINNFPQNNVEIYNWETHQITRDQQECGNEAEQNIQQMRTVLYNFHMQLIEEFRATLKDIKHLQSYVLDIELMEWKREQQLAGNGKPLDYKHLDTIQDWCEQLADIIWLTRTQMKECSRLQTEVPPEAPDVVDELKTLQSQLEDILTSLVKRSFIIEKQPVQVIKTDKNVTCTVRLLVGRKLNVHMTPPNVKVSIITENTASALLQNESENIKEHCIKMLNDTRPMTFNDKGGHMSVNFRNLKLCDIKTLRMHMEKKGAEGVTDQKFALYFQSSFTIGGGDLAFTVWELSLPVVGVVHSSQEADAWATVSWDNAFAEKGRKSFSVPESVPWSNIAQMLNMKIKAATGKGLTEDNIKFLCRKVFRNLNIDTFKYLTLTWALLCKDNLPERNFTFWNWFYEIQKVICEYMKPQWCKSSITGFIERNHLEKLLKNSVPGTFMLRFSDSVLGGITIAWVKLDNNQKNVYMLKPCMKKDLATRGLCERIHDFKHLKLLYPNIPKDDAFIKNPNIPTKINEKSPYVETEIKVVIPGMDEIPKAENSSLIHGTSAAHFGNIIPIPIVNMSPGEVPMEEDFCNDISFEQIDFQLLAAHM